MLNYSFCKNFSEIIRIIILFLFTAQLCAQKAADVIVPESMLSDINLTLKKNKDIVKYIENKLEQNELPKLLRNLSLIESHFNPKKVSSAKAAGIWQFTIEHAAEYGLADKDRFDMYKSTGIAVKSLKNLYKKHHNWITVIAAYNCGNGNINKAIKRSGSTQYHHFYRYLPNETIQHVYKFMQACKITGELDELLIDYEINENKILDSPKKIQSIKKENWDLASTPITTAFDLEIIANGIGVSLEDLKKWNQGIEQVLEQKGIAILYLPYDKMPDFQLTKSEILKQSLLKKENNG